MKLNHAILSIAAMLFAASLGAAAQQHAGDRHHTVVSGDTIKWGPGRAVNFWKESWSGAVGAISKPS